MKRQFFFFEIECSVWELVLVWKVTNTKNKVKHTVYAQTSLLPADRRSGLAAVETACFVWLSVCVCFFFNLFFYWASTSYGEQTMSWWVGCRLLLIPALTAFLLKHFIEQNLLLVDVVWSLCEHYRGLTYRSIEFTFLIHSQIKTSIHASYAHQPDSQTDKLQNTCQTTTLVRHWPDTFTTVAQLYIHSAVLARVFLSKMFNLTPLFPAETSHVNQPKVVHWFSSLAKLVVSWLANWSVWRADKCPSLTTKAHRLCFYLLTGLCLALWFSTKNNWCLNCCALSKTRGI